MVLTDLSHSIGVNKPLVVVPPINPYASPQEIPTATLVPEEEIKNNQKTSSLEELFIEQIGEIRVLTEENERLQKSYSSNNQGVLFGLMIGIAAGTCRAVFYDNKTDLNSILTYALAGGLLVSGIGYAASEAGNKISSACNFISKKITRK